MAETALTKSPSEIRVRDPLSDVTRKERRALLGVGLLGLVIAKTGLIPTEIAALGVKFGTSDQKALLSVLALATGYFVVAFALYAASDFLAWRLAFRAALREAMLKRRAWGDEDEKLERELSHLGASFPFMHASITVVSALRATFEFLLPMFFGIYAIYVLSTTNLPAGVP